MTANVTSLAKVRAAARDKIARQQVNDRATTVLLVLVVVLIVVGLGVMFILFGFALLGILRRLDDRAPAHPAPSPMPAT